jgi:flagellar assembly factor FliW
VTFFQRKKKNNNMTIPAVDTKNTATEGKIKAQTSRFGEIEVDPALIITMTSPFLGFPESTRFILRPGKEDSPFMWLQSLDDPELAFVIIQPHFLGLEYAPPIPEAVKEELKINTEKDQEILLILTIPEGKPQDMTANLLGPIIINSKDRLARQVVLDPNKYELCWPVFDQSGA